MMRIICFLLAASGAVIMGIAAVKQVRLAMSLGKEVRLSIGAAFVKYFSLTAPFLFAVGFLVGALDVAFRDVEPIFLFVVIMFFFAALWAYSMVETHGILTNALHRKNQELHAAMGQIEAHNLWLKDEVEDRVQKIVRQDALLHKVNDVANLLLSADTGEFEPTMQLCMGMMAGSVRADRMYVWQNFDRDGITYTTQVHEWSEGTEPRHDNDLTVDVRHDAMPDGWKDTLKHGDSINGPVCWLAQNLRDYLLSRGIVSILVVPVLLRDAFWGFVGFDDCHGERVFTHEEETMLRSGSLLIVNAMLRYEVAKNLIEAREAALAETSAKSDFWANMSHEIRTPINAITGMAAIARQSDDPQKINDCLNKIDIASHQLLALVNDVLDMSKIEAGKLELANEPFAPAAVAENVASIISVRAAEKNQHFTVNISPDMPKVVVGDDMRLSQVLLNLLSNAVKFTPEGGNVDLAFRFCGEAGGFCCLEASVRDTGIGMDEEQMSRLFGKFEQADRGTARRFGGTGLGLVISKRIAEMMGGTIAVESAPGQAVCSRPHSAWNAAARTCCAITRQQKHPTMISAATPCS